MEWAQAQVDPFRSNIHCPKVHRNTLVYRLDKIQKITGLDLRVFDDAITFKIALMVVKYMKYMESKDTF